MASILLFYYSMVFKVIFTVLPGEYNILRHGHSAESYYSCVVYQALARYFVLFDVHSKRLSKYWQILINIYFAFGKKLLIILFVSYLRTCCVFLVVEC